MKIREGFDFLIQKSLLENLFTEPEKDSLMLQNKLSLHEKQKNAFINEVLNFL